MKVFACSGPSGTNIRNTPGGTLLTTLKPGEVAKVLTNEEYQHNEYVYIRLTRGPEVILGWVAKRFGKITELPDATNPPAGQMSAEEALGKVIAFCEELKR